uniref:Islet cell autoantigen 1, 69kDa n=1 Tax=Nothobranchius furzeri TaxID=105023 RepID=A0A1A8U7W8_NOTFU
MSVLQTLQEPADKLAKKKARKPKGETENNARPETTDDQLISLGNGNSSDKTGEESEEVEKDSLTLLNEILGGLFVDEDFSQNWTDVFGETEASAAGGGSADTRERENSFFLPSQLLDQSLNKSSISDWTGLTSESVTSAAETSPEAEQNRSKPAVKGTGMPKDLSAWFNLFADLDPLSNPDAIGKTDREHELHTA